MKLIRKSHTESTAEAPSAGRGADGKGVSLNRRAFLRNAGLTVGGVTLASQMVPGLVRKSAAASTVAVGGDVETKRTICGHCSVGCGIYAKVRDGVWVGQEPAFDHPFNLGAHCAKGAAVREHGHGERRLKYPMKMVDGKWKRISWEEAIDEIGDKMMEIREASGPDSVYWLGSAKHSNEQAYLLRKFAALWGSNNIDHQARICHSTTVAGVANTWGYGAMTNSYNDMLNSKAILIIGGNPAEAHPVSMQFTLRAKEQGAKLLVIDPRFTRTAAHADQFVRLRPGSDIAVVYGMMWHIFENGWEDKEFLQQRVWGMDQVLEEVKRWTPDEVERVSGVDRETCYNAAKLMADNRPGTFVWCMGGTQHTVGNNFTRAYCHFQLALGNMGKAGGGTNIFRGHDNVQGATDFGVLSDNLPGYYGLSEGAWKHWAAVWDLDYDQLAARFDQGTYEDRGGTEGKPMNTSGIPVSRWIDGVLEDRDQIVQNDSSEGDGLLGPRAQLAGARARDEEGLREAGPAGGHRSVPDRLRGHARAEEQYLPAARDHAVRDLRFGHGLEPLRPVA
jgi:formate dehydrogenase major subunit